MPMSVGLALQVVTQLPDCAPAAAWRDWDAVAWLAALGLASADTGPRARLSSSAPKSKEQRLRKRTPNMSPHLLVDLDKGLPHIREAGETEDPEHDLSKLKLA